MENKNNNSSNSLVFGRWPQTKSRKCSDQTVANSDPCFWPDLSSQTPGLVLNLLGRDLSLPQPDHPLHAGQAAFQSRRRSVTGSNPVNISFSAWGGGVVALWLLDQGVVGSTLVPTKLFFREPANEKNCSVSANSEKEWMKKMYCHSYGALWA